MQQLAIGFEEKEDVTVSGVFDWGTDAQKALSKEESAAALTVPR